MLATISAALLGASYQLLQYVSAREARFQVSLTDKPGCQDLKNVDVSTRAKNNRAFILRTNRICSPKLERLYTGGCVKEKMTFNEATGRYQSLVFEQSRAGNVKEKIVEER